MQLFLSFSCIPVILAVYWMQQPQPNPKGDESNPEYRRIVYGATGRNADFYRNVWRMYSIRAVSDAATPTKPDKPMTRTLYSVYAYVQGERIAHTDVCTSLKDAFASAERILNGQHAEYWQAPRVTWTIVQAT